MDQVITAALAAATTAKGALTIAEADTLAARANLVKTSAAEAKAHADLLAATLVLDAARGAMAVGKSPKTALLAFLIPIALCFVGAAAIHFFM